MDVSQILPNLFVGSFPKSTEDIDRLRREGITTVLNAQTDEVYYVLAGSGTITLGHRRFIRCGPAAWAGARHGART